MARTTTSLKGLFSFLLKPATDALYAETGRVITTEGWGRIARNFAAKTLRALAAVAEVEAAQQPAPVPAPVAEVQAEPVAVVPVCDAPVPVVTVEAAPVPFGWGSLDLPTLMAEQTADRVEHNGEFPTDRPHYGMSEPQWEAFQARFTPTPEAAPVEPKAEPKPAKVAKVKPTAKPKATPKGKPSKAPSKPAVALEPLTVAKVAERLKTQPRAVRKWIEAGRLTATKTAAGWTVAPADLDTFLATLDAPKSKTAKTLAK